jgi:hypothetical protein
MNIEDRERLIKMDTKLDILIEAFNACQIEPRLTSLESNVSWIRRVGGFFCIVLSSGTAMAIKKVFM